MIENKIKNAFQSVLAPSVYSELEIKMFFGSGWVLLTQLGIQLVSFTKSIVLARLLTPQDFGIFGIALIIFSVLQTVGQLGVSSALIHRQNVSRDDLNNAWSIQLIRGSVFALILLLLAPVLSNYYQDYVFVWIMILLAITVFVQGLSNIGLVVYQVQIDYRNIFAINVISLTLDILVSIWIAVTFHSVLALSFGLLINSIAITLLSFVVHPFRPRLQFSRTGYRSLLSYGKWIWSGQIVVFLITEGDDVLVAVLIGPVSLGYYRMSYFISNLPATQLTNTLGQVSFSAFSKVSSDLQQLRRVFLRTLERISYLTIPLSFGIFLLLPEFVNIVLGENWQPVIPVAQILVLWGALRSIGSTTAPLFQAVNQSKLVSYIGLLQLLVLFTIVFPLLKQYALSGVALAVVISGLVQVPLSLAAAQKIARFHWSKLILPLGKPLIGSSLMFLALQELKTSYWAVDSLLEIVLIACVGLVLYVFVMQLFQYGGISLKRIFSIRQPIV